MATEKMPAFQFYPKDFLTDENVVVMSNTEVGIYARLLCFCWLEGSLPIETAALAPMVRMPIKPFIKFWESSIVRSCFRVGEDGRLHHKRLDEERLKQMEFKRRQSDRGKEGAKARWKGDGASIAQALPKHSQDGHEQAVLRNGSPVSSLQSPISRLQSVSTASATDDEIGKRAAKLLERYQELYRERRKGARVLIKPSLDFQRACDLCQTWPDDRLEKMAVILLDTDDDWVSRTDRGFGVFASRAGWCDDRLKQWELKNGIHVTA